MGVDQRSSERSRLAERLVREHHLVRVATAAAARHATEESHEAVAYCLAVLVRKDDPVRRHSDGELRRTFDLDPEADSFAERLAHWADEIARNLRRWGRDYAAIHDEADVFEINTLRRLVRTDRGDDLVDRIADELAAVLAGGPRIEEMTLALFRDEEPPPNEYAFQTPLARWVATAVHRKLARGTSPLDDRAEALPGGDVRDDVDDAEIVRDDVVRALAERIAELAETRGLLAAEIERADRFEATLALQTPRVRDDAKALIGLRADLVHVAQELQAEMAALPGMLAYLALGMRTSQQLQRVAILSLRVVTIERAVIDALAARMHAIVGDDMHPTPTLVRLTRAAADDRRVPGARATALEELAAAPASRTEALAPVVRELAELPATLANVAAIAPLAGAAARTVTVNRSTAARELTTVNRWFGRAFRRYAMGIG